MFFVCDIVFVIGYDCALCAHCCCAYGRDFLGLVLTFNHGREVRQFTVLKQNGGTGIEVGDADGSGVFGMAGGGHGKEGGS